MQFPMKTSADYKLLDYIRNLSFSHLLYYSKHLLKRNSLSVFNIINS